MKIWRLLKNPCWKLKMLTSFYHVFILALWSNLVLYSRISSIGFYFLICFNLLEFLFFLCCFFSCLSFFMLNFINFFLAGLILMFFRQCIKSNFICLLYHLWLSNLIWSSEHRVTRFSLIVWLLLLISSL